MSLRSRAPIFLFALCLYGCGCEFFVFHLAEVIPQCSFIMCQPALKLRHTAIPSVQRKHKAWCFSLKAVSRSWNKRMHSMQAFFFFLSFLANTTNICFKLDSSCSEIQVYAQVYYSVKYYWKRLICWPLEYSLWKKHPEESARTGKSGLFPTMWCVTNFGQKPNDWNSNFEALMKIHHSV